MLAASAVSSASFAEEYQAAKEYQTYVTVGGAAIMQTKLSALRSDFRDPNWSTRTAWSANFKKPGMGGELLLGVGYAVDDVRLEAVFVKPFFAASKVKNMTIAFTSIANPDLKIKGDINSLQLRSYIDVANLSDVGKIYLGGGLGWAQVKSKLTGKILDEPIDIEHKSNNFAWTIAAGAAFNVANGVKLGLEYNYQDFDNTMETKTTNRNHPFKCHAIVARLNFSI